MSAWNLYGCTRLSSIIERMRKRGYSVTTQMIKTKDRFGSTTLYAKYIYNPPSNE